MHTAALIVAAGRGTRAGGALPKQYQPLAGAPVIAHALAAFARHARVSHLHAVIAPEDEALFLNAANGFNVTHSPGGATRQDSVRLGLAALPAHITHVLIHDAARPFVPADMIDRILDALETHPAALPVLPIVDSLRTGDTLMTGEIPRDTLWRAQTPQGFELAAIRAAHAAAAPGHTDDAAIAHAAGLAVALVPGDEHAMKLTHAADFARAAALLPTRTTSGTGFDVHRFGRGDHVWLCGVRVPHSAGVIGHSDADVALHALTDAILGAIGDGDIGTHFPPSDPQWKGASSDRFLAHAAGLVSARGGVIDHVDLTIIAEAPKVGPHRAAFTARLAEILAAHAPLISVKATTTERLGFTGRGEGIAAQAIATVTLPRYSL
ncbi:bifunctional 2-C-methyl-D-erythritol 4-phosphate cytidylyltransferase/2-C-methyl-D-erythritol 2,4-cyclodiphosphate synthase [Sandaracinobacteroides saxicola]|uniref:Bifunctional enzyme IspD/IspF n=1 Tax=Sandaracinobacteroides saxicola TaxID=2759707 RepID=A0A7G5ILP2_9SPHN|nr:bifunctional 2-C-methyl-D-erythritol 4-phosphate cytidylyltransferase/2-C-methyl-D-erythritol 2,4-cyclodiphosphate synthase [Sandaracinobacteroides saxicola]QMW24284.1 bifunctional 2-C-methyl-D-erythritol 4-phosphate cytidylyltransferase/2-C-methyl-D-erythritol 2,4-cyclodiphosphate synthase [Sandaracinobacteroides saxicola]